MLEPATPNSIPNQVQFPPPPVEIDSETEYDISEILDSKIDLHQKPYNLLYLVCWAIYKGTDEEMSWVLATKLNHSTEIVTDFHSTYPSLPGFLEPELRLISQLSLNSLNGHFHS
jgi:hypothetical protein